MEEGTEQTVTFRYKDRLDGHMGIEGTALGSLGAGSWNLLLCLKPKATKSSLFHDKQTKMRPYPILSEENYRGSMPFTLN